MASLPTQQPPAQAQAPAQAPAPALTWEGAPPTGPAAEFPKGMRIKAATLFEACERNEKTGKDQMRCTLCKGRDSGGVQPAYAHSKMHAHLANTCKALSSSTSPADKELLLTMQKTCPPSLARGAALQLLQPGAQPAPRRAPPAVRQVRTSTEEDVEIPGFRAKAHAIFQPSRVNEKTGKAQVQCSLCKGECPGGFQPTYAKSKMHAHLAFRCKPLAESTDPGDQAFLQVLRINCPASLTPLRERRLLLPPAYTQLEDEARPSPSQHGVKQVYQQQASMGAHQAVPMGVAEPSAAVAEAVPQEPNKRFKQTST